MSSTRLPSGAPITIGVLLAASFVVILNETVLNVALPHLMEDLNVTANQVQWVATALMLTMAVVIPTTGFMLNRLSVQRVFGIAMGAFSVGTAISALSPNFELLVAGRVVQGFGTAIMMPLLMTTILRLVPAQRRGAIMGNVSIVMAVAPAMGPTVSGLILSILPWRFLFVFILPIALAALWIGYSRLEKTVEVSSARLDIFSVLLSIPGFGLLVYALSSLGNTDNDNPAVTWLALGIAVVSLAIFTFRQLNLQVRATPLLDLRVFGNRDYTISVILMLIAMMSLFGVVIILPIYMQSVRGLETVTTGLVLLPGGLVMGLMGPIVGRMVDRLGARPLAVVGGALLVTSLFLFTQLTVNTPIWFLIMGHIVLSIGLSLIFTPVFAASMAKLPRVLYPHGSAVLSTLQQVAAAAGTALLVAVMQMVAGAGAHHAALMPGVTASFQLATVLAVVAFVLTLFMPGKQPVSVAQEEPSGQPA